jgi:hypothetical protein
MLSHLAGCVLAALLLALPEACASNGSAAAPINMYFGGHLPFTGPAASIVNHAYDGMLAALEVHGAELLPGLNVCVLLLL